VKLLNPILKTKAFKLLNQSGKILMLVNADNAAEALRSGELALEPPRTKADIRVVLPEREGK
jgi:hypothetical protein